MKRRIALFSMLGFVFFGSCNGDKPVAEGEESKPVAEEEVVANKVRLKTSKGEILIELNPEKAPITVENFVKYVNAKHYDGTVFHRVIDGFMIQGGGMEMKDGRLSEKPTGAGIKNESNNGLKNVVGSIAMARTSDPNSATAQFFINVNDNNGLNYPTNNGYAVFGKVIEGMDVVNAIKEVPTAGADVPTVPIVIESARME